MSLEVEAIDDALLDATSAGNGGVLRQTLEEFAVHILAKHAGLQGAAMVQDASLELAVRKL